MCQKEKHSIELDFFCKNHNQLCCAACLSKIKNKEYGQHKECEACHIQDIKEEKKNKLRNNIQFLDNLSNNIQSEINELKAVFLKVNENKENLKIKISKIFTQLRSELNEREDAILLEVDQKFDDLFFKEEFIKESEKLPKLAKNLLDKGKIEEK